MLLPFSSLIRTDIHQSAKVTAPQAFVCLVAVVQPIFLLYNTITCLIFKITMNSPIKGSIFIVLPYFG